MGKVVICCGGTGRGKTSFVKKSLSKLPGSIKFFIYDVNQEYKIYYNKPLVYMVDFFQLIRPVKNSCIVFEEATIFFNHSKLSDVLLHKLVCKRHDNNIIFLNFHSLRKVPVNILDLCNDLILFKTNDSLQFVESKYKSHPEIFNAFLNVNKNQNDFYYEIVKIS